MRSYTVVIPGMCDIPYTRRSLLFLTFPGVLGGMNGDDIRASRERRGWTQAQLAQRIGVGPKTISNWERDATVPQNRAAMIREVLGLDTVEAPPLASYSEIALLSELLRRAAARGAVANG